MKNELSALSALVVILLLLLNGCAARPATVGKNKRVQDSLFNTTADPAGNRANG